MKNVMMACTLLLVLVLSSCGDKCETCITQETMYQYGIVVAQTSSSSDVCGKDDIQEAEGTASFDGWYNGHPTQIIVKTNCN